MHFLSYAADFCHLLLVEPLFHIEQRQTVRHMAKASSLRLLALHGGISTKPLRVHKGAAFSSEKHVYPPF